jgi:hypothetical protein
MELCSKPFEPDLDDASGGKMKNIFVFLCLFNIAVNPLIFSEMSGFLFFEYPNDK